MSLNKFTLKTTADFARSIEANRVHVIKELRCVFGFELRQASDAVKALTADGEYTFERYCGVEDSAKDRLLNIGIKTYSIYGEGKIEMILDMFKEATKNFSLYDLDLLKKKIAEL